ncbi:MAG: hypothetical protein AAF703_12435 [Cyanobacteria bacterium P01_D01_bin.105]
MTSANTRLEDFGWTGTGENGRVVAVFGLGSGDKVIKGYSVESSGLWVFETVTDSIQQPNSFYGLSQPLTVPTVSNNAWFNGVRGVEHLVLKIVSQR